MNELYHHGILGQKWGIRRYQNEDGTLTNAGRKHIQEYRDKVGINPKNSILNKSDDATKRYLNNQGIKSLDSNSDIIEKGSVFQRLANSDEKLDSRRKYVSFTPSDNDTYGEMFDMIGIDESKPISTFLLEAKKDLKIAKGEKVINDIIDEYGDITLKNMFNTYKEFADTNNTSHKSKIDYTDMSVDDYLDNISTHITKGVRDILKSNMDEINKKYSEEGYDAIVDVEDWLMPSMDYPLIVLNPENSLGIKKEYHWDDDDERSQYYKYVSEQRSLIKNRR